MRKEFLIFLLILLVLFIVIEIFYFTGNFKNLKKEINPEFLNLVDNYKQLYDINDSYIDCIIEETCNGSFRVMLEIETGNNLTQISNDLKEYGEIISTNENSIRFKTEDIYKLNELFNSDFVKNIEIYEIKSDITIESLLDRIHQCNIDGNCAKVSAGGCISGIHFVNKEYTDYVKSYYKMVNVGVACATVARSPSVKEVYEPTCIQNKCTGVFSEDLLCDYVFPIFSSDIEESRDYNYFFDYDLTLGEIAEMCGIELKNKKSEEPLILDITNPSDNSNVLTESINITATTDEYAVCQYKKELNHPNFGSTFQGQMNITDGTSHSQILEGLKNGGAYTIIIDCEDESGNSETDSVKFFVDLAASDYYQVTNRSLFLKYIGHGIGGRIYTRNELPHLLGDEEFYSGGGTLVKSTPSLRLGGTIENSTSNGDLDFPEVLLEVGTDYNDYNYLYKYQSTFKTIDFSIMHIPAADSIQLFGKYYKVQEGSTNNKIILKRAGSNKNIILENNQLIKVDNEIVNGTHVEFKGDENGIHEITIRMAMQNPNKDYIAVGESYDNPIFPNLRLTFESYSTEFGAEISLQGVEL